MLNASAHKKTAKMAGDSHLKIEEFLVPDHILLNSPSRSDGVDEETENELRIFGCELIQEAGILLKLYFSLPRISHGTAFAHQHYNKATGMHGHGPGLVSQILLQEIVQKV